MLLQDLRTFRRNLLGFQGDDITPVKDISGCVGIFYVVEGDCDIF